MTAGPETTPLLSLEAVEVRRRGRRVLGPISLSVRSGEFWGVVGPNGAGKSTLLGLCSGLLEAESGEVSILGRRRLTMGHRQRIRREIGVLLQQHDYSSNVPLTVEEVVLFGRAPAAGLGRRHGEEDYRAVKRALEAFGMEGLRHRRYTDLSGGERQKTQLARLLAQESELILLDEPTSGLDLDWQERMVRQVALLHEVYGRTVLMVTHDIDHLPSCCNRVLLLKTGRVLRTGEPGDVFQPDVLSELYGCRMQIAQREGRYHAWSDGLAGGDDA